MSLSRRQTLALLGGGTIFAATAAAGGFLTTRTPHKARAPWNAAGSYDDPRLFALSYAILAPNPHNRQPWVVELSEPGGFVLHRDKTKDLPETDPFARQLTIGLGCFLELLTIAASAKGYIAEIATFPEGEDGPVAQVQFHSGAPKDILFDQVLNRRSCKEPFAATPVPPELTNQLSTIADIHTNGDFVAQLKQLTLKGWMIEAETPRTMKESVDLMRFGKSEINANPDGIDLGGPFLESLMLTGMISREAQLDPASTGFQEGVRIYTEMLQATPAYAVITTQGNDRVAQIDAGRRWLRLNLTTTRLGLALHPISQVLQEFVEMKDAYDEAHALLARPGETVQMLGRLGYGPEVPPSPRWPLETRIANG